LKYEEREEKTNGQVGFLFFPSLVHISTISVISSVRIMLSRMLKIAEKQLADVQIGFRKELGNMRSDL